MQKIGRPQKSESGLQNFRHTIKNPVVNVLPQTTIQSLSIVRSRTQIKRLPKTGDNRITWLSWFGILFLISSFGCFYLDNYVERRITMSKSFRLFCV